jgi:hypothetical protein
MAPTQHPAMLTKGKRWCVAMFSVPSERLAVPGRRQTKDGYRARPA